MEDNSAKLNGYKPKSWGDLVAIASLLAMFLAVVAWGLKIEGRDDLRDARIAALERQLTSLQVTVNRGILPRAEEQNGHQDQQIAEIYRKIEKLEDRHVREN